MLYNYISSYNVDDLNPDTPIDKIMRYSERALSLLARNKTKPLLQLRFINIVGAIEIIAGAEYHFDNMIRISSELASGRSEDEVTMNHEAVGWGNSIILPFPIS